MSSSRHFRLRRTHFFARHPRLAILLTTAAVTTLTVISVQKARKPAGAAFLVMLGIAGAMAFRHSIIHAHSLETEDAQAAEQVEA